MLILPMATLYRFADCRYGNFKLKKIDVMKAVLSLIMFALIIGCTKPEFSDNYLIVSQVSTDSAFIRQGDYISISAAGFSVFRTDSSFTFPVVISENRLIIETKNVKHLFATSRPADSVLVLNELYNALPLVIKLKIIKNKN